MGQREVLEEPQPCVRFNPCCICWAPNCVQAHMQFIQEHVDHGGTSGALLHWLWRHWDGDTFEPRDKSRVRSELRLQRLWQSLCRGRNMPELQMLLSGDTSAAQLLYTTLKWHPTGSWTVIPVSLRLVWTQPAQEKRPAPQPALA